MSEVDQHQKVSEIKSKSDLEDFLDGWDNSENTVFFSNIPKNCLNNPCVLGIDEAGRGPVLGKQFHTSVLSRFTCLSLPGPLVYGISFCSMTNTDVLKDLGCADSKQLTEEKRDAIFYNINSQTTALEDMGWAVEIISPHYISNCMLRRSKHSLNEVSMESAIGLIKRAIALNVNIAEIYVDTVGPPETYQARLSRLFPNIAITVAKKADATYPIVSAASICAKVVRDAALRTWKFHEDAPVNPFGSGYPGDPLTKAFLEDNVDAVFGYPRIVRFSWATAEQALEKTAQKITFQDDNEDVGQKYSGPQITSFFKTSEKTRNRCAFFRQRHLQSVQDF
ncbi:ribonuclease H2 subunit A [Phlebotomus argentipes]|uniref:ribonuclease H2 subunit A n=1 Tax=Phlebotomus argentipes TaxID=94469 RepID=UPI002893238D|nr:ribonuclease H2 subunit A [Phlebotomus argentipes]